MYISRKVFSILSAALMLLSFAACSSAELYETSGIKDKLRAQYGENKIITDSNYDK